MTDLESISGDTVEIPINGRMVKASLLTLGDMGTIGVRWRQECIDCGRNASSMRNVALEGHMMMVANIATSPVDAVRVLTNYDLQRIALGIACGRIDQNFDARRIVAGDGYPAVDALLVASRMIRPPQDRGTAQSDPFGKTSPPTGPDSPGELLDITT